MMRAEVSALLKSSCEEKEKLPQIDISSVYQKSEEASEVVTKPTVEVEKPAEEKKDPRLNALKNNFKKTGSQKLLSFGDKNEMAQKGQKSRRSSSF